MKAVGGTAVTLTGLQAVPHAATLARADEPCPRANPRPAEALIRELHSGLTADQRRQVVLPLDHGASETQPATRVRFYNNAALIGQFAISTPPHSVS